MRPLKGWQSKEDDMDIDEKKKIVAILEYIAAEIDDSPLDSISDIVNEALEQWPVIDGTMDKNFHIVVKK
jgi:hypothetical protein